MSTLFPFITEQLNKLITRLLDKYNSAQMKQKGGISTSSPSSSQTHLREDRDLNRVSPEELTAAKAKMNETFEKNRKKVGDAGFVYDKRVHLSFVSILDLIHQT